MNRFRRWLFNFAAVASLLLCLLTIVDWCMHSWRTNVFGLYLPRGAHTNNEERDYTIATGSGDVIFSYWRVDEFSAALMDKAGELPGPGWHFRSTSPPHFNWKIGDDLLARIGFGVFSQTNGSSTVRGIEAPSWFFVLTLLALPVMWGMHYVRRIPEGCCQQCGYDLRATPERCPECGTIVAPASS